MQTMNPGCRAATPPKRSPSGDKTRRARSPGLPARTLVAALVATVLAGAPRAEFTNRYPKLSGFNHQIYVEGYELPILNAGLADPAVSPDGRSVAVAVGGHLWLIPLTAS
ncbi:MAG TPA: hypothetical protein PLW65_22620, partial [Pseudomonadota bacterium]|nr:hypothetical protein [Pseudomonadota bacterium]